MLHSVFQHPRRRLWLLQFIVDAARNKNNKYKLLDFETSENKQKNKPRRNELAKAATKTTESDEPHATHRPGVYKGQCDGDRHKTPLPHDGRASVNGVMLC